MNQVEKNKTKQMYKNIKIKNKKTFFLIFSVIGLFFVFAKAKAVAPLIWGAVILASYLGGEAVNMGIGGVDNTLTYKALAGPVGDGLADIFSWLLYAVNFVIYWLIEGAAILLETGLKPDLFNSLINGNGVYIAWSFIRDSLNLFFMLILLFSAFATIFQVEKYNLKKMIVMLIVMALLVNFSYPISLFIVDFSNMAMYFFVDNFFSAGVIYETNGEIASKSAVIMELLKIASLYKEVGTGHEMVASLIVLIIMSFIVFITIFSYAISLTVRMVALVILVTTSPIGFALSFFPATKGYADEWWSKLFKYAVAGPVLVFFLALAIITIGQPDESFLTGVGDKKKASVPALLAYMVIPVTFLWAGLTASQKLGGAASSMGMNMLKGAGRKIRGYAWGGVGSGAHWVDRKMAEKTGYSYMGLKQGWKDRQHRADSDALATSSGKMENVLEHVISRTTSLNPIYGVQRLFRGAKEGGIKGAWREAFGDPSDRDRTDYDHLSRAKLVSESVKDIKSVNTNSSYVMQRLDQAGSVEEAHAAIRVLAENNDLNDLMNREEGFHEWNPDRLVELLKKVYAKHGVTDDKDGKMGRMMMEVSDIGAANANFGYYNIGHWDEKANNNKGGFVVSDSVDDRANAAAAKLMNFEPQARQRMIHPDSMFLYEGKKTKGLSQTGIKLLDAMQGDDLAQSDRTRGDVKNRMHAFYESVRAGDQAAKDQYRDLTDIGKKYVQMLHTMKSGKTKAEAMNETPITVQ